MTHVVTITVHDVHTTTQVIVNVHVTPIGCTHTGITTHVEVYGTLPVLGVNPLGNGNVTTTHVAVSGPLLW